MTDEDQLRELQALWAQLNDDKDIAGWTALYAADGKFVNARGTEFVGHDAIRKNLADRVAAYPDDRFTKHICGPSVIRIDGDTAETSTDYVCYARVGDGAWEILTIGRFHNRLVRQDAHWLFAEVNNSAYVRSTLQWRT